VNPHTLNYRAAVKQVVLATSPETRPELAAVLAELRPYVEAWDPGHTPPRGLALLWAALCGAPKQVAAARRYLSGAMVCTRDSALAPPGWTVEQERRGPPRKERAEVVKRAPGRPRKILADTGCTFRASG
jgi:hypothetical protein